MASVEEDNVIMDTKTSGQLADSLMTTYEVAETLRCEPQTVRRRWKAWGLKPVWIGGKILFWRSDILRMLEERQVS